MAKVTITIEDNLVDGTVKAVSEPNFEQIMHMEISGHEISPAQGYALCAINAIRSASKRMRDEKKSKLLVTLPGLKV